MYHKENSITKNNTRDQIFKHVSQESQQYEHACSV